MEKQQRHLLVEQLFQAALALPPDERTTFLASSCGQDADLLSEVQSLIFADLEAQSFLAASALEPVKKPLPDYQPEPLTGRSFGHYQILELLGRGGMGEVYCARDLRLARDVAIKFVPQDLTRDESRLRHLEREARVLASLNHSNIATIHGLEYFGDARLLVMEMCEGEPLDAVIAREPISIKQAMIIFRQIAEALEAAHARGVIHRDLKPANLVLTTAGRVKVLDFGLAKALQSNETARDAPVAPLSESGVIMGTPGYMSPEQARGEKVDHRTDIWAFGCVCYEVLTGQKAFTGNSLPEILSGILRDEPDWNRLPTQTPPRIRALLQQCFKKNVDERPLNLSDAQIAFDESLAELQQPSRKSSGLAFGARRFRLISTSALPFSLPLAEMTQNYSQKCSP